MKNWKSKSKKREEKGRQARTDCAGGKKLRLFCPRGQSPVCNPLKSTGNQNTQNTITLFLSPSCPHCHTAYKDAKDLILKYPDKIKLEIAYNLNINNTENTYSDIAKVIMKLRNNKGNFIDALDDWHIRRLNIEEWKMKWFTKNDFLKENEEIDLQYRWCIKNEFNYAPVKIFNGKLLSQHYEINELFYFFKEVN